MVATPVFEETQGFTIAAVPVPFNVLELLMHAFRFPPIVGFALTVKVTLC